MRTRSDYQVSPDETMCDVCARAGIVTPATYRSVTSEATDGDTLHRHPRPHYLCGECVRQVADR